MVSPVTTHRTKPMKMITVEIKSVFGNEKIYPVSVEAHTFARLIKQKTFTEHDIAIIKDLGYEVQVQSSHPQTL
jgi:hypothetical protein